MYIKLYRLTTIVLDIFEELDIDLRDEDPPYISCTFNIVSKVSKNNIKLSQYNCLIKILM